LNIYTLALAAKISKKAVKKNMTELVIMVYRLMEAHAIHNTPVGRIFKRPKAISSPQSKLSP